MAKIKGGKSFVLIMEILITLFGTILATVLLVRAVKAPSVLGVLGSVAYLVTYICLIVYATMNYSKSGDVFFKIVLYSFASVLGIQILQSGQYMSDYGLAADVAVAINCCNLISFANIIKSSENLNNKKIVLVYTSVAVVLKLAVEIYLIIKMISFIQIIHVLMSLSIPILGLSIMIAYICRDKRLKSKNC